MKFSSPSELADFSVESSAVFFLVGSFASGVSLTDELIPLLSETEKLIHFEPEARIFLQMQSPDSLPAIGVWSAKGTLIGYRDHNESTVDFLEYARRYT